MVFVIRGNTNTEKVFSRAVFPNQTDYIIRD